MEKYMKFPMYEETKDKKYRDDPYRAVNFRVNEAGRLGKKRQTLSISGKSLRFPFGVI